LLERALQRANRSSPRLLALRSTQGARWSGMGMDLRCTLVCASADGAAVLRSRVLAAQHQCASSQQLELRVARYGWKEGMTVRLQGMAAEDPELSEALTRASGHEIFNVAESATGARFFIDFGSAVELGPDASVTTSTVEVETHDLRKTDFLACGRRVKFRFHAAVMASPYIVRDAACLRLMESRSGDTNAVCMPLAAYFFTVRKFIEQCAGKECRWCRGSGWLPLNGDDGDSDSERTEVQCQGCAGSGTSFLHAQDLRSFFCGEHGAGFLSEGGLLRRAVLLALYGPAASAAGYSEAPARSAHHAASLARVSWALRSACPAHLQPWLTGRVVALVAAFAQATYAVELRFHGNYLTASGAVPEVAKEVHPLADASAKWRSLAEWVRSEWDVEIPLG